MQVADFISLFNFEWHGHNEVGNIAILVLWREREQLYSVAELPVIAVLLINWAN